jgi:uncharacterized protein with FMN-binding domain
MRTPSLPRLPTVVVVIAATVALIASFRNTPHVQKGRLATVQPRTAPAPTPTPPAQRTRSQTTRKRPAPAATRRVTGSVIMTAYGPVQVRIKVRGSRILSIDNLALPFDRNRSQEISSIAGPLLRTEALRAQSARIDVVSGATYTSDGYAQSLQSALDRANA